MRRETIEALETAIAALSSEIRAGVMPVECGLARDELLLILDRAFPVIEEIETEAS